jgi:hypothetical protein
MNKNQIAILVLIVAVAGLVSYFASSAILGDAISKPVNVETIEPLSSEIVPPDPTVYTKDAINPTVPIAIGTPGQNPLGN